MSRRRSRRCGTDHARSLPHRVKAVGSEIFQGLLCAIGPENSGCIDPLMVREAAMQAEIALRQVAAAADDFTELRQVAGGNAHAGIESESIAVHAFQLKADPVVERAALRTQDHGLAGKVLHDRLKMTVVEQIADSHAPADLQSRDRVASRLADVFEGAVTLVEEKQFRLAIAGPFRDLVHL